MTKGTYKYYDGDYSLPTQLIEYVKCNVVTKGGEVLWSAYMEKEKEKDEAPGRYRCGCYAKKKEIKDTQIVEAHSGRATGH